MCGIAGVVGGRPSLFFRVPAMLAELSPRGPDGQGACEIPLPWGRAAIGTTRLAIVDRRPLELPLRFPADGVSLAFNGEIYDWRALRAELSDGTPWATECDAEVLSRGWRRWGVGVLDRVDGMFALALVDELEGRILLARDHAGEKPLYYAVVDGVLWFASEIKALGAALPLEEGPPCPELEALEYDCLERTPFAGVLSLPPASSILLAGPGDVAAPRSVRWWAPPAVPDPRMRRGAAVEECRALVVDAVRSRASSEVPSAVLLSGGLDSSLIQAVARLDRAFACTFPEPGFDVLAPARLAAAGAEVVPVTFGREWAEAELGALARRLDTPATWTALAHAAMARRAREDGIKVVLSGEGADEAFLGYSRWRVLLWLDRMARDPALDGYAEARERILGGTALDAIVRSLDRSSGRHAWIVERLALSLGLDPPEARRTPAALDRVLRDPIRCAARTEWHTSLQVLLRMADRCWAGEGIENRSPFLARPLVEFAFRCPTRLHVGRRSKAVLRDVAASLGVPGPIVLERSKRGLPVPWNRWRGIDGWGRADFAAAARAAWREAFFDAPEARRVPAGGDGGDGSG